MATVPVEPTLENLKALASKVREAIETKVPPVTLMSRPSATLPDESTPQENNPPDQVNLPEVALQVERPEP